MKIHGWTDFLYWYLSVGVVGYVILFVRGVTQSPDRLETVTVVELIRGLLGILVWPYILWHAEWLK